MKRVVWLRAAQGCLAGLGLGPRWRAPCRRAPTEGICRSNISPRRRGATASASSRRWPSCRQATFPWPPQHPAPRPSSGRGSAL